MSPPPPLSVGIQRRLIDLIDDAMVDALALRQRLAGALARHKQQLGLPARDAQREADIEARARRRAERRRLDGEDGARLMQAVIAAALVRQRQQADAAPAQELAGTGAAPRAARVLLARLPPPERLAVPLRAVPYAWHARLLETAVNHVLAVPQRAGKLAFMRGRRLAIEVTDLGLRWVLEGGDTRLHTCAPGTAAEAAVCGKAIEFLLLASRLEDPDTLFFQRRLAVTGDTELGLTARNLLDQLPWESLPLALRILLNRSARFAAAARDARCGKAA